VKKVTAVGVAQGLCTPIHLPRALGILRPWKPAIRDERLRAAAFAYLDRQRTRDGDRISYRDLEAFELEGERAPLIQRMRGIRVVSGLEAALSILTTYAARPQDRPYEDTEGPDGYWRYKWRGDRPRGLRQRGPSAGHKESTEACLATRTEAVSRIPDGRRSKPVDFDPGELEARLRDAYAVDLLPLERVAQLFRLPRTPDPPLCAHHPRSPSRIELTKQRIGVRRATLLQVSRLGRPQPSTLCWASFCPPNGGYANRPPRPLTRDAADPYDES